MNILVHTPKMLVVEWRPQATHMITAGGALAGACLMFFSKDARQAVFWFGLICLLGSGAIFFYKGMTQQWVFDREAGLLKVLRKRPYFGIKEQSFPLSEVKGVELVTYMPKSRTANPEEETRTPRYALHIHIGNNPAVAMHEGKLNAQAGLDHAAKVLDKFIRESAA